MLNGLRQVGKTTVLQQLAHEIFKKFQNSDESIIYISLDQILISGVKVEDFMVFLNENINPEKNLYIFLDEIQVLEK
ncbi:MAG: AAA family ATPase [Mollicutes bacterium]|nr:MAG: AAA family ATPase [Mollicutes bacterium]